MRHIQPLSAGVGDRGTDRCGLNGALFQWAEPRAPGASLTRPGPLDYTGRLARRPALLKAGQTVRQPDPAKPVTSPGMTHRRKGLWVIEAAGGHIDPSNISRMPIRQRCAANNHFAFTARRQDGFNPSSPVTRAFCGQRWTVS